MLTVCAKMVTSQDTRQQKYLANMALLLWLLSTKRVLELSHRCLVMDILEACGSYGTIGRSNLHPAFLSKKYLKLAPR